MLDVAAEAHRDAGDVEFDDAAEGVAVGFGLVDGGDGGGFCFGVDHAHLRFVGFGGEAFGSGVEQRLQRGGSGGFGGGADGGDVAADLDSELFQKRFGERSGGDSRGGFAGRGTVDHRADVVEAVFDKAGQVGVAGARDGDFLHFGGVILELRHRRRPVLPVAVADDHRHRRADGLAEADAGKHLGAVGFDLHATAASVALLAAGKLVVDVGFGEGDACRESFDDGRERRAVRFACGEIAYHISAGRDKGRNSGSSEVNAELSC